MAAVYGFCWSGPYSTAAGLHQSLHWASQKHHQPIRVCEESTASRPEGKTDQGKILSFSPKMPEAEGFYALCSVSIVPMSDHAVPTTTLSSCLAILYRLYVSCTNVAIVSKRLMSASKLPSHKGPTLGWSKVACMMQRLIVPDQLRYWVCDLAIAEKLKLVKNILRLAMLQTLADKLKNEKRSVGSGRKWRSNFNRLNTQLLELEDDHNALEMVFPQVGQLLRSHLLRSNKTSPFCMHTGPRQADPAILQVIAY